MKNNKRSKTKIKVNLTSLESDIRKDLIEVFKIKKGNVRINNSDFNKWLKTPKGLFIKSYFHKLYSLDILKVYRSFYYSTCNNTSTNEIINDGLKSSLYFIISNNIYNLNSVVIPNSDKKEIVTRDVSQIIKNDKKSFWDKISDDAYGNE